MFPVGVVHRDGRMTTEAFQAIVFFLIGFTGGIVFNQLVEVKWRR